MKTTEQIKDLSTAVNIMLVGLIYTENDKEFEKARKVAEIVRSNEVFELGFIMSKSEEIEEALKFYSFDEEMKERNEELKKSCNNFNSYDYSELITDMIKTNIHSAEDIADHWVGIYTTHAMECAELFAIWSVFKKEIERSI